MSSSARLWIAVSATTLSFIYIASFFSWVWPATLLTAFTTLIASCFLRRDSGTSAVIPLGIGLAVAFMALVAIPPGVSLDISADDAATYHVAVQLFCLALVGLYFVPALKSILFPMLLIGHLAIAVWVVKNSTPVIDVLVFQQDGAESILSGKNPYALTFVDPFGGQHPEYYGEGVAQDGRLLFGFPYPPMSLLFTLPGWLLGDVRYAHIAAVLIASTIMYRMAGETAGKLAAALFLFTPGVFHLEQMGWTEPFLVLALTATVATRSAWALALFLGLKQYVILVLPVVWRALGARTTALGILIGAAVSLPLVLWNLDAFLQSAVWLQFRQPWRADALSFAVLLNQWGFPRVQWLGFLLGVIAMVYTAYRRDKHPAAFTRNVALIFLAFFAFSKQAFFNYYFLVIGTLCCAIAASGEAPSCDLPTDS